MIDLIRMLNGIALINTPGEPGSPVSHVSPKALAQFLDDDF
ncbi:hypothetical protein [Hyphomonas sp.]|nr:hypothetical protein [Hyphomonas sp.]